jgi:hypothetical protein
MISPRMQRFKWLGFAFSLVPTAIIAALLATFFTLSFWQGLGLLLAFQLASAVWNMIWSSVWFRIIGRRTLVAEFLDLLRGWHYPKPEDHDVSSPHDYFSEVRDGSRYPVELRTDAATVAAVIRTIEAATIQRSLQLDAAWTEALTRYQREFALDAGK